MTRLFVALGAVLAATAVVAGAFGAHALQARLSADRLLTFETAARYQMYHALALIVAGWAVERFGPRPATAAGWLFLLGVLVFCATLYGLALGGPRWLGAVTPVGGLCFITGWLALAYAAVRA
ncbi:MAG: DUF423 domain-containing protein [Longimicrobiales bacterium]